MTFDEEDCLSCPLCKSWIYDDEDRIELDGEVYHRECYEKDEEEYKTQEDDYYTQDYRHFFQYRKLVVTVPMKNTDKNIPDDWRPYVKEHMEQERFWPNVWFQGERGVLDLLSIVTGGFASEANREG